MKFYGIMADIHIFRLSFRPPSRYKAPMNHPPVRGNLHLAPRSTLRVNPDRLPPVKPRPPERESLLFPWLLATLSGTLLLWGVAMILFKLRLLPFRLCPLVTNAIALLATASAAIGLLLALLRRFRHP